MNTVHHQPHTIPTFTESPLGLLEDLLTEATAPVDDLNDFSSLEALLADSLSARREADAIKEKRRLLANGKIPTDDRESVSRLIRSWELKREWIPAAAVQFFSAQQCSNCGSIHHHYTGEFQRQISKHSKVSRWIKSDAIANRNLPQEAKCEESTAPVCADCSSAFEDA